MDQKKFTQMVHHVFETLVEQDIKLKKVAFRPYQAQEGSLVTFGQDNIALYGSEEVLDKLGGYLESKPGTSQDVLSRCLKSIAKELNKTETSIKIDHIKDPSYSLLNQRSSAECLYELTFKNLSLFLEYSIK